MIPTSTPFNSTGKSTENRDLWVVKLSTDRSKVRTTLKPLLKLVGGIHGNEGLSSQLLFMLSEYLMQNFGKNNRVTRLLNQTEIHILPIANPDGREIAKEGDCDGSGGDTHKTGRENAKGVDIDNDFPGPFDSVSDAWKVSSRSQSETLERHSDIDSSGLFRFSAVVKKKSIPDDWDSFYFLARQTSRDNSPDAMDCG